MGKFWLSVTNSKCGSHCAPSAGHNLEPNIPPPPSTQSINTYYFTSIFVSRPGLKHKNLHYHLCINHCKFKAHHFLGSFGLPLKIPYNLISVLVLVFCWKRMHRKAISIQYIRCVVNFWKWWKRILNREIVVNPVYEACWSFVLRLITLGISR